MSTQFISTWPIDRNLSVATTPDQSGPENNGNEEVLSIPQSSRITGISPSECLVSYLGHSLVWESYTPAEKQSGYSTAPADWAMLDRITRNLYNCVQWKDLLNSNSHFKSYNY